MNKSIYTIVFYFLVFVLQLFICDYVNLGSYTYICFIPFIIFSLPLRYREERVILIAFLLGLLLDILSDGVTGLNASAAVLIGALRKPFYRIFVNKDRQDKTIVASISTIGIAKYLRFIVAGIAVYLLEYILVDCISLRSFSFIAMKLLVSTVANTVLTLLIGMALNNND